MRKIIHHLRRQPEETRRNILFIWVVIASIVLFALWIYSLGTTNNNQIAEQNPEDNVNPFSVLKDSLTPISW